MLYGYGIVNTNAPIFAKPIFGRGGIPYTYILDTYSGASFAYSFRKLRSAYSGYAIRVRRSSDNTSQDIGFTGNSLDTASLLSFVGANDGFVSIWYDQSGNARNMNQATSANQPKIVSSGSLITSGGNTAMTYDGTDDYMINFNTVYSGDVAMTMFQAVEFLTLRYNEPLTLANTTNLQPFIVPFRMNSASDYGVSKRDTTGTVLKGTTFGTATTGLQLSTFYSSAGAGGAYNKKNGSLLVNNYDVNVGNINVDNIGIGALVRSSISGYSHMKTSEIIMYATNQSANVTAIESDINSQYTIY